MQNAERDLPGVSSNLPSNSGPNRAPSSPPSQLPSSVFSWEERVAKKTAVGFLRGFFDAPTGTLRNLEFHATTVAVGEASHAAHRHPDEELVIVKEGRLEVTINGNVQYAGAGSVIFYASNDLHGMRNAGETPVTYHVIRWISSTTPA